MSSLMLTIPKQITKVLKKMETLEKKESALMKKYNAIVSTCGYCQIPYVGHNALDKALIINKKRLELWKEIRGSIFGERTLWQIGIDSKYPIVQFDSSSTIDFGVKEIKEMISMGIEN